MADKNYEDMSDEEFMNVLDNLDDIDDENDTEDTDQHTDDGATETDDAETNEENDGFFDDTEDEDEDDQADDEGENSQDDVEEDDSDDDEDEDDADEDEDADDETADDSDDESDTESEDESDADEGKTEQDKEIDYQKAYEEAMAETEQYKKFYSDVTSEFVANGKVMKGFNDPKKIIQAQQMAAGFSDKMKAFKQYRPFINPLKEKGIIDNPDKFNLLLSAMDGDKEAIKKMISDAEIDPVELDMDNIDYQAKNAVSTDIELAYDDVVETAKQYGVQDRVQEVISKDWDDGSVVELLEDPQSSADLVNHLSNGIYDLVQTRISEKKMTDPYGAFGKKRAIEQYREAAGELESEYMMAKQQQQAEEPYNQQTVDTYQESADNHQFSEDEIQIEMAKIREERDYASKVEKRNAEADRGRKKAASVSKRKPRSKKKETNFDPGQMSDEEFTEYLDSLILT